VINVKHGQNEFLGNGVGVGGIYTWFADHVYQITAAVGIFAGEESDPGRRTQLKL
jgi:hypothetical protein